MNYRQVHHQRARQRCTGDFRLLGLLVKIYDAIEEDFLHYSIQYVLYIVGNDAHKDMFPYQEDEILVQQNGG